MMETWKDVHGFEGFYQVSNMGKVRSVPRTQKDRNGKIKQYRGKELSPVPNSAGYWRVELKSPYNRERFFVHRLVAEHFVTNPEPQAYKVVNHLDSDFHNNKAENLEWTDLRGNSQHALKKGRLKRTEQWLESLHKAAEKQSKPVIGYNPATGEVVAKFKSIQESGRNGFEASSVCNCCNGKRHTHHGLAWKYDE